MDGLKGAGCDTRLVNTTKASDYSGMKYTDDRHDASVKSERTSNNKRKGEGNRKNGNK